MNGHMIISRLLILHVCFIDPMELMSMILKLDACLIFKLYVYSSALLYFNQLNAPVCKTPLIILFHLA